MLTGRYVERHLEGNHKLYSDWPMSCWELHACNHILDWSDLQSLRNLKTKKADHVLRVCQSISCTTETVFTDDAKNESANNHDADGESIGENYGRQSSECRENRCNDKKKYNSDI